MRELMKKYRHLYKPEIIDNTEFGLELKPEEIVAAEIAQGELIRRAAKWFENYDVLICPGGHLPAVRRQAALSRRRWTASSFEGYMGWLILTCAITVTACPVIVAAGRLHRIRPADRPAAGRPAAQRGAAVLDGGVPGVPAERHAPDADRPAAVEHAAKTPREPKSLTTEDTKDTKEKQRVESRFTLTLMAAWIHQSRQNGFWLAVRTYRDAMRDGSGIVQSMPVATAHRSVQKNPGISRGKQGRDRTTPG